MKWYLAILLTMAIFGCMVVATTIAGSQADHLIYTLLAISAVWAAAKSSSVGWGLFVFFLWPVGFPYFLIARYGRPPERIRHGQEDSARKDLLECPSCGTMIPPGETKCPRCGWS